MHSAGGTLKAGVGSVRLRLLAIILESAGFSEKLSVARLMMDLRDDDKLAAVQKAIRQAGKETDDEFDKLYTSRVLQQAYLDAYPHFETLKNVSEALRAQYPAKVADVSIDDTVEIIRRTLAKDKKLPCTLIVLDEIQQFINNSADIALEVQEVVEASSKMLDGQVLFVGTGQSALSDTPALQKLMGRFTIRVHLKDNDVEKVVRTVVLRKKEERKEDIRKEVERHSGEIERQLKSTKISARSDDDQAYVPDYPLLPVRRPFLGACAPQHGRDGYDGADENAAACGTRSMPCRSAKAIGSGRSGGFSLRPACERPGRVRRDATPVPGDR